ncbi:MAG: SDR family NAD(P)-dependent oxidoreductase [Gammaproteobacteria bacterium]
MELGSAKALVTGGCSGLGLAVGRALSQAGARVAVLDIAREGAARVSAALGPQAHYLGCDVRSEEQVQSAVREAGDRLGGITLAVNCAGIFQRQRVVGRDAVLSGAQFAQVLEVNLFGTFLICREVANRMQHNQPDVGGERGVIINTSSIAADDGQTGLAAYAAAKGGVASLTLPLAREFSTFAVRVIVIAPGLFDTPMLQGLTEQARADLCEQVPFPKRLGHPEEFAALVCHIYQNPMLNGTVIRLDGGLRLPGA